jgi:hypothetical protein
MSLEDDYNSLSQQPSKLEADYNNLSAPQSLPSQPSAAAQETLNTIGNPKDPNFDTTGLQDWEHVGGIVEGTKRQPGFLKTLDNMTTGVHRGVTHFTFALMSKLPFGEKYQEAIKKADADIEAEQQKNIRTYSGIAPQVGEFAGEMLATAPLGGAYLKTAQLANKARELAAPGFKMLSQYGTNIAGSLGLGAAAESQRYDPENPTQLINTKAASDFLTSPAALIAPIVATRLGNWVKASQEFNAAKEIDPNVVRRDLYKNPTVRSALQQTLDFVPALTQTGKRVEQMGSIGPDIQNWISKTFRTPEAMNSEDLTKYAADKLTQTFKRMKDLNNRLWEKGFKNSKVEDVASINDISQQAMNVLKTSGIPTSKASKAFMTEILGKARPAGEQASNILDAVGKPIISSVPQKGNYTVGDVKNLQSLIGDAAGDAYALNNETGRRIGVQLSGLRDKLFDVMGQNISKQDLKDFTAARTFSRKQYEMMDSSNAIRKAAESEQGAIQFIDKMLKKGHEIDKTQAMGLVGPEGQNAVRATKLTKLVEQYDKDGGFNLSSFINATKNDPQTKALLGKDYHEALQGLNNYLSKVKEGTSVGFGRQLVMGGLAGGSMLAGGGLAGGIPGIGAAVVAYPALSYLANNSPAKRLLGALTKDLPKETYEHIFNKVGALLSRSGIPLSKDETNE